ncbi:YihY/virulence factor BrkB family protein [Hoyosella sp. YIM 151337]|uniref:YhjD/YihY/BrkB family envelope integrity protein n=1 Tax=Hoyosella sp. YIM 151337 TaxID=2992742 RepID=UPI0022354F4D|nr:YhjD/YihY/BrkB family envelope integrity protein [Hoyosella sp. YIM 151337]MCW4352456.1 YihY/virulence factor BrkB family protein [Hoyosella sp. YIM 151337]
MADKPSFLDKQRAKYPWFDHLMRAVTRFNEQHGDYYAAGITYFSVFALAPLMLVGFATAGFVLARNETLLADLQTAISDELPGGFGEQIGELLEHAIEQRGTALSIGLILALYAGLGWIGNLRKALTMQWGITPPKLNFITTKISDLGVMAGLFLAIGVSLGLTALSATQLMDFVLSPLGLYDAPGVGVAARIVSFLLAVAATWLVFTWVIAKLPRYPVAIRSAVRAALGMAIFFEIFKQFGQIYLTGVMNNPAGAVFGPIIGILVFVYFTARALLLFTAWAATSSESMELAPVAPPEPVMINMPVVVREGNAVAAGIAAFGIGAATVVGLSALRRKEPQR